MAWYGAAGDGGPGGGGSSRRALGVGERFGRDRRRGRHGGVPAGRWAVEPKTDGVVVGTVLLVPLPGGEGEHEVGWHLHPDAWGNGYASEAARGLVDRAFAAGLDEVLAVVRPGNRASVAVCRRIGMEALGMTDRYYATSLELYGLRAPR